MILCAWQSAADAALHATGVTACVVWVSATDESSVASNYTDLELLDDKLFSPCRGEPMPLRTC